MKNFKKKALHTTLIGALGLTVSSQALSVFTVSGLVSSYVNTALRMFEFHWDMVFANVKGGNVGASILITTKNLVRRITEIEINLVRRLDQSDLKISSEIDKATNIITERIMKVGQANIQANAARANFRREKAIEHDIHQAIETFEQPITNCLQFAASQAFADGMLSSRLTASQAALAMGGAVSNASGNWELEEFELNQNFQGKNKYKDLQAGNLFGGSDGSLTRRDSTDNQSVKSVINYLTGLAYAPKNIGVNQDSSDNGREYSRVQRQYAAYTSLSSYVLSTVAANHTPNKALLSFYEQAGLSVTEEQKRAGVSLAELYDTYTQKMLSKPQIEANASAKTLTLLRSMSQMDSMALYMEVQDLQQQERLEALKAAELSLKAHQVLGSQARLYLSTIKQ